MTRQTKHILLVDDEAKFLNTIAQRLALMGFSPLKALGGMEALALAKSHPVDLAIVDLQMPGMDGLVTIAKLKEINPRIQTFLLTGYGSEKIQQATESLDAAYFEKDETDRLWEVIKKFSKEGNVVVIRPPSESDGDSGSTGRSGDIGQIEIRGPENGQREIASLREPAAQPDRPRMIGETEAIQQLRRNIERLAALDCPVIIRGETGTGKELVAKAIHRRSARKNSRFLAINCGCFSNELLFGELFGAGNTTGSSMGASENATRTTQCGGTILLDQIEDMSMPMQIQLLRMIDSNKVYRADGTDPYPIDVRILVATHEDLRKMVEEKRFREDLYYRLNLLDLYIPPLRERRDDIPPLCSYFLDKIRKEFNKDIQTISDEVLATFMRYHFPGNVRELLHIIERAVILADGKTIGLRHLPERFQKFVRSPGRYQDMLTLNEMEKRYILEVLEATAGNKSKAADVLGISRAALWRKLKSIH